MRRDPLTRGVAVALSALTLLAVTTGCGRKAPSAVSGTGARTQAYSDTPTPTPSAQAGAYFTHPKLVADVLSAAQDAALIIGSYDYRDMAANLTEGLKVTTGGFRASYQRNMPLLEAAAVQKKQIVTVTVAKGAVGKFGAGETSAVVVMVIKQVTATGANDPAPKIVFVTVSQTMQLVGDTWLVSKLEPHGSVGIPPGTSELAAAETAARKVVLNTLTYTRANFGLEFERTLAGATGKLRGYISAHRADVQQAMIKGKFDLRGQLDADAAESATGRSVVFLVAASEYKISDSGDRTLATASRFEVTMTKVGSKWLASKLDGVGTA
jgi:hypothetical protein